MQYDLKKGEKFGRLTIMGETKKDKHNNIMERCMCECGNETWLTHHVLIKGITRSCGCLLADTAREKQRKNCRKHGLWTGKNRFSRIYQGIRRRCKNKNDRAYPLYGGRGIKILWNSIEEFYSDMHESYVEHCNKYGEKNTTIDRIDVDGDYCRENCKRSTYKQQQNNRTNNTHIEIDGVVYNTKMFAMKFNIKIGTARVRINKYKKGEMSYETLTHVGKFNKRTLPPKKKNGGKESGSTESGGTI